MAIKTKSREDIVAAILAERERQGDIGMGDLDRTNVENDFVAYITAYAGRAARKVARNDREGQTFDENMIKVAALAIAALEVYYGNQN